MARTHHTTLYGTAQSMREKVSQSALTAGMRTRGMHGAGAWKKGGRSGQYNQGRDAQWTSSGQRPAALTHGAEPTLATGMEVAPEAAARRDPLSTYFPLRRCAVMPHARTRSSSCAVK